MNWKGWHRTVSAGSYEEPVVEMQVAEGAMVGDKPVMGTERTGNMGETAIRRGVTLRVLLQVRRLQQCRSVWGNSRRCINRQQRTRTKCWYVLHNVRTFASLKTRNSTGTNCARNGNPNGNQKCQQNTHTGL